MIGLIGLGNMGMPIARRLQEEHGELVLYDSDPAAMVPLIEAGAIAGSGARDVADRASIVLACLPDEDASQRVAAEVAKGAAVRIYAELSTIGPDTMREIATVFAATTVQVVDAPVSGGAKGARDGSLSLMLAGDPEAVAHLQNAVLPPLGKVLVVGTEPGQAQLCKLINNALSFTALVVSSEAVAVGVKAGIDPRTLLDVVSAGTGRNSAVADKLPRTVLTRSFDLGAQLGAALKDLRLFLDEAGNVGQVPGVIAETDRQWRLAVDALGGEQDAANLTRYFEDLLSTRIEAGQAETAR